MLSSNEFLETIKFHNKVEEYKKEIQELKVQFQSESFNLEQRNQCRRQLHSKIEILRLDCEEFLLEWQGKKYAPKKLNDGRREKTFSGDAIEPDMDLKDAFHQLDELRSNLKLEILPMPSSILLRGYLYIRYISFLLLFTVGHAVFLLLLPLRGIHPILRKMKFTNSYLPMDWAQFLFARCMSYVFCIECKVVGKENLYPPILNSPAICMFTHVSNLDALLIQTFSPVTFKFMAKKELFILPIIGWTARWAFGIIPVDRHNRSRALRSLERLGRSIREHKRLVALAPEGMRSKDGLLCEFKKGPFYMMEEFEVPVIPVLFTGTYESWPSKRAFSLPARPTLRFLPPFFPDPKLSRDMARLRLRRLFLTESYKDTPEPLTSSKCARIYFKSFITIILIWVFSYVFFLQIYYFYMHLCVVINITSLQLMYSVIATVVATEIIMLCTI